MKRSTVKSPRATTAIIAVALLSASLTAAEPQPQRLWESDAPGALGSAEADTPTIMVYHPKSQTPTAALVIFPGGGYGHLAVEHEGHDIAEWASSMSMAGIIVSY